MRGPDLSLRKIEYHGIRSPPHSFAEYSDCTLHTGWVERIDPNRSQRLEEWFPLQLSLQHNAVKRSVRT